MPTPQDYLTEAEAQRLKQIADELAGLKRMCAALNAEKKRLRHRSYMRALIQKETATIRARRAEDKAAMSELRFEGTV